MVLLAILGGVFLVILIAVAVLWSVGTLRFGRSGIGAQEYREFLLRELAEVEAHLKTEER